MHNEPCGGDDNNPINEFLSDDEDDEGCHDDGERKIDEVESPTHLSKLESEEAINMSSRHSSGMLKKTEGKRANDHVDTKRITKKRRMITAE